jgi:predicted DNA-binding transcriptional regulator AlpA
VTDHVTRKPDLVAGRLMFIALMRIPMKKLDLTDEEVAWILSRRQETAEFELRIQQRFDRLEKKLDEVLAVVQGTSGKTGEYLSLDQVCELLNISRSQLWRMRKSGKIAKPVIEYPLRWRRSDIERSV